MASEESTLAVAEEKQQDALSWQKSLELAEAALSQ